MPRRPPAAAVTAVRAVKATVFTLLMILLVGLPLGSGQSVGAPGSGGPGDDGPGAPRQAAVTLLGPGD